MIYSDAFGILKNNLLSSDARVKEFFTEKKRVLFEHLEQKTIIEAVVKTGQRYSSSLLKKMKEEDSLRNQKERAKEALLHLVARKIKVDFFHRF